jgi:hypothetical protein
MSTDLAAGEITKAKGPNAKQTEQIEPEDPLRTAMRKLEFWLFYPTCLAFGPLAFVIAALVRLDEPGVMPD